MSMAGMLISVAEVISRLRVTPSTRGYSKVWAAKYCWETNHDTEVVRLMLDYVYQDVESGPRGSGVIQILSVRFQLNF